MQDHITDSESPPNLPLPGPSSYIAQQFFVIAFFLSIQHPSIKPLLLRLQNLLEELLQTQSMNQISPDSLQALSTHSYEISKLGGLLDI